MIFIKELNIANKRGVVKNPVSSIVIDELGVVNDAHRGNWHRQITILTENSLKRFEKKHNRPCKSYEFATNLYISGIEFEYIGVFDKFEIGDVVLEVTQIGKEPHIYDSPALKETGESVMFQEGIFARVISGGEISINDKVKHIKKKS